MTPNPADENSRLRQACAEAKTLLDGADKKLRKILDDEPIILETPLEASNAMELTAQAIAAARRILSMVSRSEKPVATLPSGGSDGPTRQQGQFLAFIREYMMRNKAGQAPSHADLQRFFNLTPPSVNSMLIRLEQRGFIRREPGKARAIEIVIDSELIPPLEGLFKF
ncbi:MAG: MarR family transcriptional regulator [Planctomycetota bacterium]